MKTRTTLLLSVFALAACERSGATGEGNANTPVSLVSAAPQQTAPSSTALPQQQPQANPLAALGNAGVFQSGVAVGMPGGNQPSEQVAAALQGMQAITGAVTGADPRLVAALPERLGVFNARGSAQGATLAAFGAAVQRTYENGGRTLLVSLARTPNAAPTDTLLNAVQPVESADRVVRRTVVQGHPASLVYRRGMASELMVFVPSTDGSRTVVSLTLQQPMAPDESIAPASQIDFSKLTGVTMPRS